MTATRGKVSRSHFAASTHRSESPWSPKRCAPLRNRTLIWLHTSCTTLGAGPKPLSSFKLPDPMLQSFNVLLGSRFSPIEIAIVGAHLVVEYAARTSWLTVALSPPDVGQLRCSARPTFADRMCMPL